MEQMSGYDFLLLFMRVQLFLFGVIFSSIATIIKFQFRTHGKISKIDTRCEMHRHNTGKAGTSETSEGHPGK